MIFTELNVRLSRDELYGLQVSCISDGALSCYVFYLKVNLPVVLVLQSARTDN